MSDYISDFKRVSALAKESNAEPTAVMIAQMLLVVRDFLRDLPDGKRKQLESATVDEIWEMTKP